MHTVCAGVRVHGSVHSVAKRPINTAISVVRTSIMAISNANPFPFVEIRKMFWLQMTVFIALHNLNLIKNLASIYENKPSSVFNGLEESKKSSPSSDLHLSLLFVLHCHCI